MTYLWAVVVPLSIVTAVVVAATARRPRFGRRMAASGIAALVLVVLTAVFDNLMIAADLFTYPPELFSGVRVGLAPIEDFSYAVCAAFLVPALRTLAAGRRERAAA